MNGLQIIENLEAKLNENPSNEPYFNAVGRMAMQVLKQEVTETMEFDDVMDTLDKVSKQLVKDEGISVECEIRRIRVFLNDIAKSNCA